MGRATDKGDGLPPSHGANPSQGSRPHYNTAHRSKKRSLMSAEGSWVQPIDATPSNLA